MTSQIARNEHVRTADHHVYMDVDWRGFETLLAVRGFRARPRMAYLDGVVELMTTSFDHERIAHMLEHLVIACLRALGIEVGAYGNWTLRDPRLDAGVEADNCYQLGPNQTSDRWPDLAIEVVWTHGDLNKLEIYRRLQVREVWIWEDDVLTAHVFTDGQYRACRRSELLPSVDFELLCRLARECRSITQALDQLEAALKKP